MPLFGKKAQQGMFTRGLGRRDVPPIAFRVAEVLDAAWSAVDGRARGDSETGFRYHTWTRNDQRNFQLITAVASVNAMNLLAQIEESDKEEDAAVGRALIVSLMDENSIIDQIAATHPVQSDELPGIAVTYYRKVYPLFEELVARYRVAES